MTTKLTWPLPINPWKAPEDWVYCDQFRREGDSTERLWYYNTYELRNQFFESEEQYVVALQKLRSLK